jgi:iron complex outermembrane recepter protein
MNFPLKTIASLLTLGFASLAGAQTANTTLDSVVVTGSRIERSSFDLPAAVDVVDAERIGAAQARVNASEALVAVPGILVQNRQNYAQDLQISSRGFGARSAFGVRGIKLIADGIPASMPDGQGQAATFNLDRAERIEVMRGPMSSVYGNHAGGVIQMFTADGKGAPTVDGNFSAGSYGSWKTDLSSQGEIGGVGYVIDVSRFATDGYRDHSAADRNQGMVKLTFKPSQDGKLTLLANVFRQDADDPQGLTWQEYEQNPRGVAWDARRNNFPALAYDTRKNIDHAQGGATYEHRLGDHLLNFSVYAGQRSTIQYQSIPVRAQDPIEQSGGVIDFDRAFSGVSGRWTGQYAVAGGALITTFGLDYEQATDDRRGFENFIGAGSICGVNVVCGVKGKLRRQEDDRVFSFDQYAQAEWRGEKWTFTGGLRHSRIAFNVDDEFLSNGDDSGNVTYSETTPSLGALYRLSDSANVYVSAARGFEAPTFNEMFYSSQAGGFNFSLKPSRSKHFETGLKAFLTSDTRLDVALFHIETDDEVVVASSFNGRSAFQNAGPTKRKGIELLMDSQWANNISSRIAYTFLDAKYVEAFSFTTPPPVTQKTVNSGNRLPGVAAQTLFGELAWKHPASGFYTGVEVIARDKIYVEDTNVEKAAPGFVIANLRAGVERKIGDLKLGGFVRLNNVFDHQYVGSVIVGDGNGRYYESAPDRNWLIGMSVSHPL